ncbi:MAG: hypothetical protein BWY00_00691 [Firmicutes bacterium ADurb.Bin153]|nr:MAG: hypothetical protein BWY00_00691 [Firmicutes bacterium ADurb.Bin153]
MIKKLEAYLSEVGHYVSGPKGADDILDEIRSHILDRAQEEYGKADDESVEKILAKMEEPREMASRYSQGQDIIAPYYRKHLILYTAFLFFIGLGVSVVSLVLGKGAVHLLPFFQSSAEDFLVFLGGLPVTFFTYFGIVCLFFMIITKYRSVKPAWLVVGGSGKKLGKPTALGFTVALVGFLLVLIIYSFQGELASFVAGLSDGNVLIVKIPDILMNAILAMTGIDLLVYSLRFLANTPVLEAAGAAFKLLVMAYVARRPLGFENLSGLDGGVATAVEIGIRAVLAIIVIIITIELIRWLMYTFSEKYLR